MSLLQKEQALCIKFGSKQFHAFPKESHPANPQILYRIYSEHGIRTEVEALRFLFSDPWRRHDAPYGSNGTARVQHMLTLNRIVSLVSYDSIVVIFIRFCVLLEVNKYAMIRNWGNQNPNPTLKTKTGNN